LVLAPVLIVALGACAHAPDELTLTTSEPSVQTRVGDAQPNGWTLAPDLNPDVFDAAVPADERRNVCFIAESDELCFDIGVGDSQDFVIMRDGVRHATRIVGVRSVPAAVFTEAYQQENRGQIQLLIPDVYEMVNIAIALTSFARENPGLTVTDTEYFSRVETHFAPVREHPFVSALDAAMRQIQNRYFTDKMNAYAFVFDEAGQIQPSSIYNRTGFAGDRVNSLAPQLEAMRSFAAESGFLDFYRANQAHYQSQITYLRDTVDIPEMARWLQANFPDVHAYDGVKIVFSPLVGWNQSLTTIENNGYRELQPHVNFPYSGVSGVSAEADAISRGAILFTEMNHGFINPTAEGYAAEIDAAIGARELWADDTKAARSYGSDQALFNEYMNWLLVSLYERDHMTAADFSIAGPRISRIMVADRGFLKFPELERFVLDLYASRQPGQTLADLYPEIITWFAAQTQAAEAG
jgi:hypothetical protein